MIGQWVLSLGFASLFLQCRQIQSMEILSNKNYHHGRDRRTQNAEIESDWCSPADDSEYMNFVHLLNDGRDQLKLYYAIYELDEFIPGQNDDKDEDEDITSTATATSTQNNNVTAIESNRVLAMRVKLEYEGNAWLSLGISSESGLSMIGSQAIIGFPDEPESYLNPGKYTISSRNKNGIDLMDDESQTLINGTITQMNNITTLSFVKLLNETGEGEIEIVPGQDTVFQFAVGYSNSLGFHKNVGGLIINPFLPCRNTSQLSKSELMLSSKALWISHAIFGIMAWALCAPMGIMSALFRYRKKNDPDNDGEGDRGWFKFHFLWNIACTFFTMLSFFIAVGGISRTKTKHFSTHGHNITGLIIFLFLFMHVLAAWKRPPVGSSNAIDRDLNRAYDSTSVKSSRTTKSQAAKIALKRVIWEHLHRNIGLIMFLLSIWQINSGLTQFGFYFGGSTWAVFTYLYWVWLILLFVVSIYYVKKGYMSRGVILG